ncbi:MAG: ABC transporter ATP-binding protein/permease [Clostridiales bacterium]|jgi:ABC-type multidrug transport system fused ATPase/permease subunit|nr:ABC transporter ATP-binding protein/permease [Clostridiales bacterium]
MSNSIIAPMARLLKQGKQGRLLALAAAVYLALAGANAAASFGLGQLVSSATDVSKSLILLSAGYLSICACEHFSRLLMARLGKNLTLSLRKKTVESLMGAEHGWLLAQKGGDLLERVTVSLEAAVIAIADFIPPLARSVIVSLAMMGVLFSMSLKLGLIFIIPVPFALLSQHLGGKVVEKSMGAMAQAQGRSAAAMQDAMSNRTMIKAYTLEKRMTGFISSRISEFVNLFSKAMWLLIISLAPSKFLAKLSPLLVCGFGAAFALAGDLDLAQYVAALSMAVMASEEISRINSAVANLPNLSAEAKRLFPIWDAPQAIRGDRAEIADPAWAIELSDVEFGYPGCENIIKGISLQIFPGEKIALVGASGSGKSTLLKLISGINSASSGTVKVFGAPPREYDPKAFASILGSIEQDAYMFPVTVKENILVSKPDATAQELARAVSMSSLDSRNVEEGFLDSNVGEKGRRLSGGQRQMVAIARLCLQDPKILLMDEATSALDPQSEAFVRNALKNASLERTVVMSCHKLHESADCDRILVLKDGLVVESGTHEELLGKAGLYASLWLSEANDE